MAKQSKLYDSYILITQYHYHHNPHPLTRQGLSISKQRCAHCAEVQMQAAPLMSAPTTNTTALGHHHTINLRPRIHYIIYYIFNYQHHHHLHHQHHYYCTRPPPTIPPYHQPQTSYTLYIILYIFNCQHHHHLHHQHHFCTRPSPTIPPYH